jgi:mannan endo-1,4-beta-mannosidase
MRSIERWIRASRTVVAATTVIGAVALGNVLPAAAASSLAIPSVPTSARAADPPVTADGGASAIHSIGATSATASGWVTRSGGQLRLGNAPFRFTGMNVYNANSTGNCAYPLGAGSGLDESLTAMGSSVGVMRAWFFQYLATARDGTRDWSAFDHTLAVARAHHVKVIVTLGNEWSDCDGSPNAAAGYKNTDWYRGGYRSGAQPGGTTSYRQWVADIVGRYRSNPDIMAWQLMNEAEDAAYFGGPCPRDAASGLQGFATDMADLVKSIDTRHLLSVGTIGSGQCGTAGAEYRALHAIRGVDLCEYHDYSLDTVPGDAWNGLAERVSECAALGKPLFVGETGVKPSNAGGTLTGRATLMRSKLAAQFDAGVAGELVWDWRSAAEGGSSLTDYDVGPGDPVLGVLSTFCSPLALLSGSSGN